MTFAQPSFLWALTAMIIPIAIHLLSRKEGKVVKVGSLRHMEESNTSRFKSVRLNEIWLLLTRCLMILWLVLFLSGAACSSSGSVSTTRWLVVENGIESDPSIVSFIDSLQNSGYELRYLSEGFPKEPASEPPVPDYWKLAETLGRKTDLDIVVVSYNRASGFKNTRPILPQNVRWVPVNPSSNQFLIQATRLADDSVAVRTGYSDAAGTQFSTNNTRTLRGRNWISIAGHSDSMRVGSRDTVLIAIENDDEHKSDAQLLKAALRATDMIPAMTIAEVDADRSEWLFWLRDDEPNIPLNSNVVIMRPRDAASWFTQEAKSVWFLNRRLTHEAVLGEHFAIDLAQLLMPTDSVNENVLNRDLRSLPETIVWASANNDSRTEENPEPRNAGTVLIILFVMSWIAERSLALKKNL